MGLIYTKADFEKALAKNKDRVLIRNGAFVGLFRYESGKLILTKQINRGKYGFRSEIKVHESGEYWGSGGGRGISAVVKNCNEAHLIPHGYDLRKKEHLQILDKCLGNRHSEVQRRIAKANPNPNYKDGGLPF